MFGWDIYPIYYQVRYPLKEYTCCTSWEPHAQRQKASSPIRFLSTVGLGSVRLGRAAPRHRLTPSSKPHETARNRTASPMHAQYDSKQQFPRRTFLTIRPRKKSRPSKTLWAFGCLLHPGRGTVLCGFVQVSTRIARTAPHRTNATKKHAVDEAP